MAVGCKPGHVQSGFLTAPGGLRGRDSDGPSLAGHIGGLQAGTGLSGASRLPAREVACRFGSSIAVLLSPGLGLGLGVSPITRGRRNRAARPRARLGLAISDDLSLAVEPMA